MLSYLYAESYIGGQNNSEFDIKIKDKSMFQFQTVSNIISGIGCIQKLPALLAPSKLNIFYWSLMQV